MPNWNPQRFRSDAVGQKVAPEILANAIDTAALIHARNPAAPILFTLGHLAQVADVPYDFLRKIVSRSGEREAYKVFALKRSTLGQSSDRTRTICVPAPLLMRTQRWIHQNILKAGSPHEASTAYTDDSSIIDAAERHCGAKWLIKLDITSFFESILEPTVFKVFASFGYQPLLAFELTRLCTRLRSSNNPPRHSKKLYNEIPDYAFFKSNHSIPLGHLPQGAPSSPLLANLVCFEFDCRIAALAVKYGLRYSRYADDLTLSFHEEGFNRETAGKVIRECFGEMMVFGFWPNRTKTKVIPPGARKIVLGLLVDQHRPALTREFRDRLRLHAHYLKKWGPVAHAQKQGFDSVVGLQNHVFGLAAYAMGVDSTFGREVMATLLTVNWPTAFAMPP